jgi:hypothetical protein
MQYLRPELREINLYYVAFFLVLAAVIAPLWIVDYPGMVDYPNHLVRCYILAHYHENPVWQQRYALDLTPLPNLAMDLIVAPLARWIPLITSGKIFLTLAATLYVIGCSELGRAIAGRPNWLALFAAFTFYNSSLLYGFVNYIFGVGVFLCVLAFWLRARNRMSAWRFFLLCFLGVVAWLSHLSSFAFLGITCTTIALVDFHRDRSIRHGLLNLAWLVCPVLLMMSFLRGSGSVGRVEWSTITEKATYLMSPIRSYSNLVDGIVLVVLIAGALVIARNSRFHQPAFAVPVMFVLFLVTPKVLFTSSAADARYVLPAFVLLVVSVETQWGRPQKAAFAIILLAMGMRTAGIATAWVAIDQRSRQLLQIGSVLPADARVYVVQPASTDIPKQDRGFVHTIEFWTVSRGASLSSLFAISGQQPLVLRQPVCLGSDWTKCLVDYDYVWTNAPSPSIRQDLLSMATPAASWEGVTLWRLPR